MTVDAHGKEIVHEQGAGVGGQFKSRTHTLPAGDAFRTRGLLTTATPTANAFGTYTVRAQTPGGSSEVEAEVSDVDLVDDGPWACEEQGCPSPISNPNPSPNPNFFPNPNPIPNPSPNPTPKLNPNQVSQPDSKLCTARQGGRVCPSLRQHLGAIAAVDRVAEGAGGLTLTLNLNLTLTLTRTRTRTRTRTPTRTPTPTLTLTRCGRPALPRAARTERPRVPLSATPTRR